MAVMGDNRSSRMLLVPQTSWVRQRRLVGQHWLHDRIFARARLQYIGLVP